jgi:Cysteine-rich secretory protein family
MYKASGMSVRSLQFWSAVKRGVAICAAFAVVPAALYATPVAGDQSAQLAPDQDIISMREAFLTEHNRDRRSVGHAPLIWDHALAADAKKWADHLAEKRIFEHAAQQPGDAAQGENLWMGTRGAYSAEEMVGMWLDERHYARSGTFPNVSNTGDWRDIGHFTQMLWPSTRRIGCALASNRDDEILVCRYFPAGNRIGDKFVVPPKG